VSTTALEIKMSPRYKDFTNNLSRYAAPYARLKKQFMIYSGDNFKLGDGRDMPHYSPGKHVV